MSTGTLMSRERVLEILHMVADTSPADQTEAGLIDSRSYLTRFTRNAVHQNVGWRNASLWIRVLEGRRMGVSNTNLLTVDGAERALKQALEIARHQKPLAVDLNLPGPGHYRPADTWRASTAGCSPGRRAEMLAPVFQAAGEKKTELAGALRTEEAALAVVNTRGVEAYQAFTASSANMLATAGESLGYASRRCRDLDHLDLEAMEARASGKALDGRNPRDLPPGRYDVVLEPAAVAALFNWLNFVSFGARSVEQGTSFLAGHEGKPVMGENVTIYDDGLEDPETAAPFDMEGVPRGRVMLVHKGRGGRPVTDTLFATRLGSTSTGHAAGPGGEPTPLNVTMEAGKGSIEDLVAGTERGLLVTRFHYVNGLLEPPKARMTGMTKDGTFLVEEGKVVGPVENLRFTESVTEAFCRIRSISAHRERFDAWLSWTGGITVPALAIRDFQFTGKA